MPGDWSGDAAQNAPHKEKGEKVTAVQALCSACRRHLMTPVELGSKAAWAWAGIQDWVLKCALSLVVVDAGC